LSQIILSQACSRLENDSIEDSETDHHLEKIHFDVSQLQVFLLPANFKSNGMTSHKHKYSLRMAASDVASFETNFFRIASTSVAETSVKGKT